MTKKEFIAQNEAVNRRLNKRMALWMGAFAVLVLAALPLSTEIENKLDANETTSRYAAGFILVLLCATFGLLC